MQENIFQQLYSQSRQDKEQRLKQSSHVFWFTGLSGSGKSTLANALASQLSEEGFLCFNLDGDNLRSGLCSDLGFDPAGRQENLRRAAETAKILCEAGLIVMAAFVSPLEKDRQMIRAVIGPSDFSLIHVKCDIALCESRDVKGLYAKARKGLIPDFTGISSPFEDPQSADLIIDTGLSELPECITAIRKLALPKIRLQ